MYLGSREYKWQVRVQNRGNEKLTCSVTLCNSSNKSIVDVQYGTTVDPGEIVIPGKFQVSKVLSGANPTAEDTVYADITHVYNAP
ncbi:hypothetical protein BH09SUM1_BH09SUM1_04820 [soil metagenome]